MGYFECYDLDSRFRPIFESWNPVTLYYHIVIDYDQRRTIIVRTATKKDEEFILDALEALMDDLPADVVKITVSDDSQLLSSSTEADDDGTIIPFYPSPSEFLPHLPKIHRSELTEIERLGLQADHTTYMSAPEKEEHVVFKYYINEANIEIFWHELQCISRIPKHPNIVPFDRLVVESHGPNGQEMVVGFTTPFIAGGTVEDDVSRVFRLKHLRQLLATIDYLNLRLGIVHSDICMWNLLIDPETDDLKIFDFNMGAKLGWEGDGDRQTFQYDENRSDVKLAVFTVYEIITRDQSHREEYHVEELDTSMVLDLEDWEKHPDVNLDEGVDASEYRRILMEWVKAREQTDAEIASYKQAPESIDWPSVPLLANHDAPGTRRRSQSRSGLIKEGKPFIKWQRPPTRYLENILESNRLLANGEVVPL
ncbi:CBL-interacting serine/threonine-protein kinase 16 [Podospora australis]|uniref:EKC/KEOPS complex subunit BUD32 n=1 Tax=Podospora australis TaxID=1536484 RepID=A0AAN6WML5_9PEZI|nr:CBL-interacting serine/threonine-protein kinase 16 [Podospora australis]